VRRPTVAEEHKHKHENKHQNGPNMKDREPTVRSRALGAALADALKAKKWSVSRAADAVGWSESRVSRLVSGKRGVPVPDVATLLAVLDVRGERRDALLAVAEDLFRLGWCRNTAVSRP
jgi:predicted XRE-type DNA-binding protein